MGHSNPPSYEYLGYEYANIVLRQETGMDVFGDVIEGSRYLATDRERMLEIEVIFEKGKHSISLLSYVENSFENQENHIKEKG